MVYSHDAFGLGNLRRMLSICEHLLAHWPDLSVLLVSGSPMIHEFRLPKGLDYIKLPCLNRGCSGELSAKYLGTSMEETVALRSQLIYSAATHFKPHLLLVDKKPTGLQGELQTTLTYLKHKLPNSQCVLLLRDILDTPKKTTKEWSQYGYYQTIQSFYHRILVVGMQSVFDLVQAYCLPLPVAYKVRYCGYIRKPESGMSRAEARSQLNLNPTDRLVLVTPGGGEDGYALVHSYLLGLARLQSKAFAHDSSASFVEFSSIESSSTDSPLAESSSTESNVSFHSLVLCGPEMPAQQRRALQSLADACSNVIFKDFTLDLLSYLKSSDAVVSMGGYNTLTEVLAFGRRAVVIPRVRPSQEQWLRTTQFAKKNWVTMLSPGQSTPDVFIQQVLAQLVQPIRLPQGIDFDGLPNVLSYLKELRLPAATKPSNPTPSKQLPPKLSAQSSLRSSSQPSAQALSVPSASVIPSAPYPPQCLLA
ncbi:MAG: glycosyltransferase [Cyanobacteria bacterium J06650_10]